MIEQLLNSKTLISFQKSESLSDNIQNLQRNVHYMVIQLQMYNYIQVNKPISMVKQWGTIEEKTRYRK